MSNLHHGNPEHKGNPAPSFAENLVGAFEDAASDYATTAAVDLRYPRVRQVLAATRADLIQALTVPVPEHAEDSPTVRDQFAMAALTGLLADAQATGTTVTFARDAYDIADEMMTARKQVTA